MSEDLLRTLVTYNGQVILFKCSRVTDHAFRALSCSRYQFGHQAILMRDFEREFDSQVCRPTIAKSGIILFMPQYYCRTISQMCCSPMGFPDQHSSNSLTLEFRQNSKWSYTQGGYRPGAVVYLHFCKQDIPDNLLFFRLFRGNWPERRYSICGGMPSVATKLLENKGIQWSRPQSLPDFFGNFRQNCCLF